MLSAANTVVINVPGNAFLLPLVVVEARVSLTTCVGTNVYDELT